MMPGGAPPLRGSPAPAAGRWGQGGPPGEGRTRTRWGNGVARFSFAGHFFLDIKGRKLTILDFSYLKTHPFGGGTPKRNCIRSLTGAFGGWGGGVGWGYHLPSLQQSWKLTGELWKTIFLLGNPFVHFHDCWKEGRRFMPTNRFCGDDVTFL